MEDLTNAKILQLLREMQQDTINAILEVRRELYGPTQIVCERVNPEAILPTRATPTDSGLDLATPADFPGETVIPGEQLAIDTGWRIGLPLGFEGQIRPRSGLAKKHQITILNSPGTIDQGYRGTIVVLLHNAGTEPFVLGPAQRIAQLVIVRVACPDVIEGVVSRETARGAHGFGSSGK